MGALSGLRQFLATESPLKMMKNEKALFVPKIFKLLSWFCGHVKGSLIKKIRLISKLMTSQPGQQKIAIQIWPNISRSKGNKAMKPGRLIEHNVRNIFPEKQYTKCVGETIRRPFSENSKLRISVDQ